jgi:predicted regulator of Ras-like GTPase activity (Roadblock/LC7/MglB family)
MTPPVEPLDASLFLVIDALGWAEQHQLGGTLQVIEDEEKIGEIVFSDGRLAWAVCRYQTETLGKFLIRTGRITRDQFREVSRCFRDQSTGKKLGVLLEEAGFVTRDELRQLIATHIRMALASLIEREPVTFALSSKQVVLDDASTFTVAEITEPLCGLPPLPDAPDAEAHPPQALRDLLEPPGHQAVALVGAEGSLHGALAREGQEIDWPRLAAVTARWLREGTTAARSVGLGAMETVLVECQDRTVLLRWLDETHEALALLVLGPEGKLGVAKHRLQTALPALREAVLRCGPRGWAA